MIKLFLPTDTAFTSNGEKTLFPLLCKEKKDSNTWELESEFLLSASEYILQDYILVVPTRYGVQPFFINNIEVSDSIKTVAQHIGYRLKRYVVTSVPFVNSNCQSAMQNIISHAYPTCAYTVYSDIATLDTFTLENSSVYDAMATLATRYGGTLDFDGFQIRITANVGSDNGIEITYGKNLEGATLNQNWDSVVTSLKPIGNNGITLTPEWLYADVTYDIPYAKIVTFSTDTVEDLQFLATMYLNKYKVPLINYKVQSNVIQGVILGDIIHVKSLTFDILTDVISYEYDVLIDRIISIEFGNYRRTVRQMFGNLRSEIEQATLIKAQLKIDEVNGSISAVANDVTNIDGRVTSVESSVVINAQAITSKVSQSYVDNKILEINSAKPNRVSNLPASFEQGTLTAGVPASSALHIRTGAFYPVSSGYVTVQCADIYEAMVVIYNSSYVYQSSQAWGSLVTFNLVASSFFKVVLRSKTGNNVVPSEVATSNLKVANEATASMWNMYFGDLTLSAQKELYQFKILSSTGLTFDGQTSLILNAYVVLDNIDVTSLMASSQFAWSRSSQDSAKDSNFNSLGLTGSSLTITSGYLDRTATYKCFFTISETAYLMTFTGNRILTKASSNYLVAISSGG